MRRLTGIAALLVAASGCTRQSTVQQTYVIRPNARTPKTPKAKTESAVTAVFARQARNAAEAGDGDIEVRQLRERIAAHPEELAPRLDLAARYRKQGFSELAVEHYRLAAERFPDSVEVRMALAKTLRDLDAAEDAAAVLRAFAQSRPNIPWEVQSLIGILDDDLGRLAEGERAYRAGLAAAPSEWSLHNNLGYNLMLQGRSAEAAAELKLALAAKPQSQITRNNLATALAMQPKANGSYSESLLQLESVTDAGTAHNNLAAVLIELGRYQEARKELEWALTYRRDNPAVMANLKFLESLDGKPIAIPVVTERSSRWRRLALSLRKTLLGETHRTAVGEPEPAVASVSKD